VQTIFPLIRRLGWLSSWWKISSFLPRTKHHNQPCKKIPSPPALADRISLAGCTRYHSCYLQAQFVGKLTW